MSILSYQFVELPTTKCSKCRIFAGTHAHRRFLYSLRQDSRYRFDVDHARLRPVSASDINKRVSYTRCYTWHPKSYNIPGSGPGWNFSSLRETKRLAYLLSLKDVMLNVFKKFCCIFPLVQFLQAVQKHCQVRWEMKLLFEAEFIQVYWC